MTTEALTTEALTSPRATAADTPRPTAECAARIKDPVWYPVADTPG
ncbi:hypothetical protein [Streptomyces sp. CC224B]|nr:hypothetical protein [Streptomyces sp. CC224B]